MNDNLTEVVVILDRSGSMARLWSDATGALDHFVSEQKKIPGECKYTLVVFDSQSIDILHTAEDITTVSAFPTHIRPRGGTPLIDAMGKTINSFIDRYDATPESDRPGGVIFAIITDGEENESTVFKKADVVNTIQEKTKDLDWKFIYLSSDINAFNDARDYAMDMHNTVQMSNTGQAYAKVMANSLTDYTTQYRGSNAAMKKSLMFASFVDTDDEDLKMMITKEKEKDPEDVG